MKKGKEDLDGGRDEDRQPSPFDGIDRTAVVLEARCFSDAQINPRKCQRVITKLLYLINQGETFSQNEAVELFFGATKLFQSKDESLRPLIYILIKELTVPKDLAIIVVATLIKDMTLAGGTDTHRAAAIRALCRLIDGSVLGQIERHLKQAIVDKSPVVSSAALVSGIQLFEKNSDLVKRWTQEVYEMATSKSSMPQYLAMGLYHLMKAGDKQAISKMVHTLTKYGTVIRSTHAHVLLIRYTAKVLDDMIDISKDGAPLLDYLESCLRNKSEIVIFEAAAALCDLRSTTGREATPAISVLQLFLNSPRPVIRFQTVRMLSRIALTHPTLVASCNLDLEGLIGDTNRTVATLAITTLLKTGNESNVERLMKQIAGFMGEIADEFKVVVIEAIRALCTKFPRKHRVFMSFLSNALREEGGFDYKRCIVETILSVMREVPESFETGLPNLCEFIEDCEFPVLSCQVLHVIGEEGPKSPNPSKFIRYLYNRIILESATVRASAITALCKFGIQVPSLRDAVVTLIKRSLSDIDDEVRDRVQFSLSILNSPTGAGSEYVMNPLPVPLASLSRGLEAYLSGPKDAPFELANVVVRADDVIADRKAKEASSSTASSSVDQGSPLGLPTTSTSSNAMGSSGGAGTSAPKMRMNKYATEVLSIPSFSKLGKIVKTAHPVPLTEAETEYTVSVIKHIFQNHIVLQFECINTIEDQCLSNVNVKLDLSDAGDSYLVSQVISLSELRSNLPQSTFVLLEAKEGAHTSCTMSSVLKFKVREIDPSSGTVEPGPGYDDEYPLSDVDLSLCDLMTGSLSLLEGGFQKAWETTGEENEATQTYALSQFKNMKTAVTNVAKFLGLDIHDNSAEVKDKSKSHVLMMSGTYMGEIPVVVKALFAEPNNQVTMELSVRSGLSDVTQLILDSVG